MQTFTMLAVHPANRRVKKATWLKNYFGAEKHGIRFGHEVKVWRDYQVKVQA